MKINHAYQCINDDHNLYMAMIFILRAGSYPGKKRVRRYFKENRVKNTTGASIPWDNFTDFVKFCESQREIVEEPCWWGSGERQPAH